MKAILILGLLGLIGLPQWGFSEEKCVQLFYDKVPNVQPPYRQGRETTQLVQNLLGHFPKVKQIVTPIESYKVGDLNRCVANLYVGTYYDNQLPTAFLADFEKSKSRVMWLGYNIWQMPPEALNRLWSVRYTGLSDLDKQHLDPKKRPGFFKYYTYRGQEFEKYGEYEKGSNVFQGAYEIALFDLVGNDAEKKVLSWARHSTVNRRNPYILASAGKFFVGDIPTSYMTEDDRYFIFADTLFDLLGELPLYPKKKPALVRLEDVHAKVPLKQLNEMVAVIRNNGIPFSLNLIPTFRDPFKVLVKDPNEMTIELNQAKALVSFLQNVVKNEQASIIYHGATHQNDDHRNPEGVSGADYEFWDAAKAGPLAEDSVTYVLTRLERGLELMENADLHFSAWVTPHYAASPLDNVIFSQLFYWQVGRLNYALVEKQQKQKLPAELNFDVGGADNNGERLTYLSDLKVTYDQSVGIEGQIFPYEIYGDVYGNRVVPETLGYVQTSVGGGPIVSPELMIKRMKRNAVLRDTWASLFVHPYLIESGVTTAQLSNLFSSALALGYEFIDLKTWTRQHLRRGITAPAVETQP